MQRTKYFQSDDIPQCEPKSDCTHTKYKVLVDGVVIKEGRYAVKQTRNIPNRIIYKRKWNVSRKTWVDSDWQLLTPTN